MTCLALLLLGCGGGDRQPGEPPGGPPPGEGAGPDESGQQGGADRDPASPEEQEGSAGDEMPIGSDIVLRGRGGRIRPREVRVPPFIAIRLELRSSDGARYELRVDGRTVRTRGSTPGRVRLEGLQPDGRYVARPAGGGGAISIVASSEPGP